MKAIRIHSYGHSDELKLEDAPRPEISTDQVLVKVFNAGLNPVDWKIREGAFRPGELPFTMGQDISGKISEVGSDVRGFEAENAVFGFASGAYAEFAAARASEIAMKPASIDFSTAASIPTAGLTAWQAIEIAKVSAGQSVLIQGAAGGVGSFAVQLAKWKGARVFGTATGDDIAYLKSLGVEAIDYRSERFEDRVHDADAVIDLVGGDTLARSYEVVKRGGIIVTTLGSVDAAKAEKRGIRAVTMVMKRDGSQLARIADLVDQGVLRPRMDRVLPFSEAKRAQDLSQTGQAHGKIVLRVA